HVEPQPQFGHQRAADGRGIVHDRLANARLHNAKLPHLTPDAQWLISAPPMEVKTLAVVGAGQMGAGIAQVAAQSGISVVLIDVNADLVEKGIAGIRAQLDRAVSKGKLKAEDAKATAARIRGASSAQQGAEAEFAVEAVTEN